MSSTVEPVRPPVMLIAVPQGRQRRFIQDLAAALHEQLGAVVVFGRSAARPRKPRSRDVLERVERRLGRAGGPGRWVDPAGAFAAPMPAADLVIDLSGEGPADGAGGPPTLRLLWNGERDDAGLFRALADGRPIVLDVELGTAGRSRLVHRGVVALLDREMVGRILDMACGRATALLLEAASAWATGTALPPLPDIGPEGGTLRRPAHATYALLGGLAGRALGKLAKPFVRRAEWGIALRRRSAALPMHVHLSEFTEIRAPDGRFYADPFLFEHAGRTFLFFEDFGYETRRGVVAVAEVLPDGSTTRPRVVLDAPFHLSYPQVFEYAGTIYMLPETSADRSVTLYEAVAFPNEWRRARVLISGVDASDATLHRAGDGSWWLFASIARFGGSSVDTLSLFHADRLDGPWTAHPMNPVKNDARSARPAGPFAVEGGRLFRPTQDCSAVYGGALTWCVVEALTRTEFRERAVGHLAFPADSGLGGPHTFTRSAAFEAIDFTRDRVRRRFRRHPSG